MKAHGKTAIHRPICPMREVVSPTRGLYHRLNCEAKEKVNTAVRTPLACCFVAKHRTPEHARGVRTEPEHAGGVRTYDRGTVTS